jgi:hypothetical protein
MAARRLTVVLDAMPVVLLAVIAGAGSFTHIRDTAAQHGQHGPMSWPIAVSVDLTCVMAARERQRDQRLAIATGRISWPAAVLAGGVLLSLSANLAQAQPTTWAGSWPPPRARHSWSRFPCSNAAPPPGDRPPRDGSSPLHQQPSPVIQEPSPAQDGQDGALLVQAQRAAEDYQARHGQGITRDALRAQLGVSNQTASDLLRQVRARQAGDLG